MNSEQAENTSEFFLKEIPNVKISSADIFRKVPEVKEEMQLLRINDESQKLIIETLKFIYGPEFSLPEASSYDDKGPKQNKKYWMDRGNLVIKGVVDFSKAKSEPTDEAGRLYMFAVMRLESYYFHNTHCVEALEYCQGDLEEALKVLYWKYFNIESRQKEIEHGFSEKELLEQRIEEKSSLESMYEKDFEEKVTNSVWIVKMKLDYIINLYIEKAKTTNKNANYNSKNTQTKKEMCRGFLRGKCKFGKNCRFSHEVEPKTDKETGHLDDYTFKLEIRFLKNTIYPFEPPLIFLKTNAVLPEQICLHICRRLYKEAEYMAQNEIPSVYSVINLLENEEEITNYLKTTKVNFLLPCEKLFPVKKIVEDKVMKPSHYQKGTTIKNSNNVLKREDMLRENNNLAKNFQSKLSDPKYQEMLKCRSALPTHNLKETILNTIKTSQVTVICGETGCGKSTQIPQFILDDWLSNFKNDHVNIVCTQPRRISAIGVAERIADERIEKIGNSVGYQIRLESKLSASTRLTFCTTGVLLRRLGSDPQLTAVTHVIVDEVHERSDESDFLLVILQDLMKVRKDLKIVLMSATLNAKLFSDYFKGVPILNIPGRTFPVEQYFLEDILEVCDYTMEENTQFTRNIDLSNDSLEDELESLSINRSIAKPKDVVRDEYLNIEQLFARYNNYSIQTLKNLYMMDYEKVNLELIESVLTWIVSGYHEYPKTGSILIFLPGIAEITSLLDQLNYHHEFGKRLGKYLLLPLHSSLSSEEQSAVFEPSKAGVRKIVISTNIAETSITIDDCVFVIDSGKMKEKKFDSNRNMESLDTVWVTQANALQRKGRAGRVMPGVCIHLITSHRFKHHLLAQPIPEMHRIPLEQLLLHIKVLTNFADKDVYEVLDSTIEPPIKENVDSAITRLQNIGAFDSDKNLTPLGMHLAALPVDVRIGKLMLYGAIFGCVDAALTIASCLSYKNPFVTPLKQKDLANEQKKKFSNGFSDQMTVLKAYERWLEESSKSYMAGVNFANENYLSRRTLVTLADIKHQLLELLVDIGFVPVDLKKRNTGQDKVLMFTGVEFNKNNNNTQLLSAILCAALYPNIAKVLTPGKSFSASACGAVPRQPEAKELRFRTKQEQVYLHPSSVNYSLRNYSSPFLVYQEKVKTSKIFIRDCTMVRPVPLALFSGSDLQINVHEGRSYIHLEEGWIIFEVDDHKIAEMIKMLKKELQNLLEEKIKDPLLNLMHNEKGEMIITTFLQLISRD